MTATDTIFALSSGAGRAAVAMIRLSGQLSSVVLTQMTGGVPPARQLSLHAIRHPATGDVLDDGMVAWFPSPHSFTGEDCAEFHVHGGQAVVAAVMAALASMPSVRPAEPGEFTRRAFANGKMDLVEVEGLADLLEARTDIQRRQAYRQMSGQASNVFESWREQLLLIRADIEAVVDFADEPGVAEAAAPGIDSRIRTLVTDISAAVRGAATAEILRDGVRVVLAGFPNTGKSSLLNALARRDAAIVSEIPGTTRDAIEVSLDIHGMPVILTDTAGLRDAADVVEREGVRRSREHIQGADVVIWVCSADVLGSEKPGTISPDLVIRTKADLDLGLVRNEESENQLRISTHTGIGLESFLERLSTVLHDRYGRAESSLLVSARQASAAENSIRFLNEALCVDSGQLELKAENIRRATIEIGRLTGKVDVEDWLGAIFSRFCIGK